MRRSRSAVALTSAFVVALIASASGQSSGAQAPARWYDAYQQGVTAVQRRDWPAAEKLLMQAQSTGPRPGRRVFTYGDSYIAFLPDYYLGVVYLGTNRAPEAEAAFARVRSQELIGARDPEYVAFERQEREAIFGRAFGEAVQLTAKGDFAQANARLEQARATKVDDGKVVALSREIAEQTTPVRTAAQTAVPEPGRMPPPATPVQAPQASAAVAPSIPDLPKPATPVSTVVPSPPRSVPPGTAALAKAPVTTPPGGSKAGSAALRSGLVAFFSGDYREAIPFFQSATQQPDTAARARAFLACAKVGLVLTGGADAALLGEARADFQGADPERALSLADRRFISPRVLDQLERP